MNDGTHASSVAPPEHGSVAARLAREGTLLVLIAAVPALLTAFLHPRRPSWEPPPPRQPEVTPATARSWDHPPLWIDARNRTDYDAGHVPGAFRLNEDDWDALLPEVLQAWDPGMRVVVYCGGGECRASREVARRLREEVGIDPVWVLRGGWDAWKGKVKQ